MKDVSLKIFIVIFLGFSLLWGCAAQAEEKNASSPKITHLKKDKKYQRDPQSHGKSQDAIKRKGTKKNFRLGTFLGISSTEELNAIALGVSGEMKYKKYLGVEFLAFHDLAKAERSVLMNTEEVGSNYQFGGFLHSKLQAPLKISTVIFTPKLGVGLGLRGGTNITFYGPTAMAGMEIDLHRQLILRGQYIRGVGGEMIRDGGQGNLPGYNYQQIGLELGRQINSSVILTAGYIRASFQELKRGLTYLHLTYDF